MKKSKSEILKKIHGAQVCQILASAARLGIFDCLFESPCRVEEIAKKVNLDLSLCKSLLYALQASYVIQEELGIYSLTEEGSYLAKNHPDSLYDIAIYKGSKVVWLSLAYLYEGLKKGTCPFDLAFGKTLFDYLEEDNEEFSIFHQAMMMYERKSSKKILHLYDFSSFGKIADIGGGFGHFLAEILLHSKEAKGLVFDLPGVIEKTMTLSFPEEMNKRISFQAGDFFLDVPKDYDCYLLRNILHNWSDEKAILILKQIRQSMPETGKILIFETILEENPIKRLGKFANLSMFTLTGGKERTHLELQHIIDQSGLTLNNIIQTTGSKALIEVSY